MEKIELCPLCSAAYTTTCVFAISITMRPFKYDERREEFDVQQGASPCKKGRAREKFSKLLQSTSTACSGHILMKFLNNMLLHVTRERAIVV
jgi:hypothetical protein